MSDRPDPLIVSVDGRPAPQGSKRLGEHGQMLEQSPYLRAWRAAVKRAAYRAYLDRDLTRDDLPLFRGPVEVTVLFRLDPGRRVDAAPDLDKLLRSTWDALTEARAWEDDGRVTSVIAGKRHASDGEATGADIVIEAVGA